MDNFKKEFEKIEAAYFAENPFRALADRKEIFSKNPLVLYGCGILLYRYARILILKSQLYAIPIRRAYMVTPD
ncbi:hypothetical protein P378_16765 [Desulforamulus profundi]|uniref:Uncharacterized protein n=1 Tax=Desulforamulus profundi TaxID=1383067 RepID=A0A2C6M563_9FIRM|nr:hypothetical protein [Desulforamulus profundi]PHJ37347.1 hypothetical protein P378_16765 [Desulforamulus profundi]